MHQLDPELEAALAVPVDGQMPPLPAQGDIHGLRALNIVFYDSWRKTRPAYPNGFPRVARAEGAIPRSGRAIPYRWYTRTDSASGPAVLYVHGGAQIMGDFDQYEGVIASYVEATGVPFLSIDYTLAPDGQGSTQADEGLAAYRWLRSATDLGVDPARIAVMGDSAGGGIAASVVALAAAEGITPALAVLVYPMLDDRTTSAPEPIAQLVNFRPEDNVTGWTARLGEDYGTDHISAAVAPARIESLHGFPRTYLEVGELDLFRNEGITFMQRLVEAGIPVEFHLWPGANHGFDLFAPTAALTRRALAQREAALSKL